MRKKKMTTRKKKNDKKELKKEMDKIDYSIQRIIAETETFRTEDTFIALEETIIKIRNLKRDNGN